MEDELHPGTEAIRIERLRQVGMEGYDAAHDNAHTEGELARLAAAYTLYDAGFPGDPDRSVVDEFMEQIIPSGWKLNPQKHIYNLLRAPVTE